MSYSNDYSQALDEEMRERGLAGVPISDLPDKILEELHDAVVDVVGERPDDEEEFDENPGYNPMR